MFLRSTGEVYAAGNYENARLGVEGASTYIYRPAKVSKVSSAVAISAGGAHSAVVTFREDLITFGKNDKGQLGREGSSSTQIGRAHV